MKHFTVKEDLPKKTNKVNRYIAFKGNLTVFNTQWQDYGTISALSLFGAQQMANWVHEGLQQWEWVVTW